MSPTEHDISDADRLSSGIIDVGRVPLRTSVSGARIEWDGVNGLVQYDTNNNVVTHLSLDGDATFSGHLEGASGSFHGAVTSYVPNTNLKVDIRDGSIDFYVGDEIVVWMDSDEGFMSKSPYTQAISSLSYAGLSLGPYDSFSIVGRDVDGNDYTRIESSLPVEINAPFRFNELQQFYDEVRLRNSYGSSNALNFPAGHFISVSTRAEDFTFYGNRAGGVRPFMLRSHFNKSDYRTDLYVNYDGTLYSTPTYNTTTSNAANVRIGIDSDGESRFLRTSSAKKYKHDIQLSDVDPYKILDLEIKSWYDKREYEENGKSTDGLRRYHALVADDVADVLPEFADYNHEGEVENYNDRVFSLLIPIVKDILERLDKLETN